jgi:hypothetical protein
MFINVQHMHQYLAVYYYVTAAPTCFGTYAPLSGNSSVPAGIHANRGSVARQAST